MSFQRIVSLLDKIKAERVILLCHQNADPDALCAAFVLSKLIERTRRGIKTEIASPEGISKLSKRIVDKLPIKVGEEKPRFDESDVIFMLDTNTIQQLGNWSEEVKAARVPIIVIDHHASHPETEKMAAICISAVSYTHLTLPTN